MAAEDEAEVLSASDRSISILQRNPFIQNYRTVKVAFDPQLLVEETDRAACKRYFTCPICLGILRDAVSLSCEEEHLFCRGCIESYWQSDDKHSNSCPVDRQTKVEIQRVTSFIQKSIDGQRVRCPFSDVNLVLQNDYLPLIVRHTSNSSSAVKESTTTDLVPMTPRQKRSLSIPVPTINSPPPIDCISEMRAISAPHGSTNALMDDEKTSTIPSTLTMSSPSPPVDNANPTMLLIKKSKETETTFEMPSDNSDNASKNPNVAHLKDFLREFVETMELCEWKGMLKELESHIYETKCGIKCGYCGAQFKSLGWIDHFYSCDAFPIYCPLLCSEVRIQRGMMNDHVKTECSNREVQCSNYPDCEVMIPFQQLSHHLELECQFRTISCPFNKYGCAIDTLRQNSLDQHLKDFETTHLQMRLDYLEKMLKLQSANNVALQKRISSMNSHRQHSSIITLMGNYHGNDPKQNSVYTYNLEPSKWLNDNRRNASNAIAMPTFMQSKWFDLKCSAAVHTKQLNYDLLKPFIRPQCEDDGFESNDTMSGPPPKVAFSVGPSTRALTGLNSTLTERQRHLLYGNDARSEPQPSSVKLSDNLDILLRFGGFLSSEEMQWDPNSLYRADGIIVDRSNDDNDSAANIAYFRLPNMTVCRSYCDAVYYDERKVLIVSGGYNSHTKAKLSSVEELCFTKSGGAGALSDGEGWIVDRNTGQRQRPTHFGDASMKPKWRRTLYPMQQKRASLSMCLVDNHLLFALGGNDKQNSVGEYTNLRNIKEEWQPIKPFNAGFDRCQVGTFYDDQAERILAVGGFSETHSENQSKHRLVEEFDLHKNEWYKLPYLNEGERNLAFEYYPSVFRETSNCSCYVCHQISHSVVCCVGNCGFERSKIFCEIYDRRDVIQKWIPLQLPHITADLTAHWNGHSAFRRIFHV